MPKTKPEETLVEQPSKVEVLLGDIITRLEKVENAIARPITSEAPAFRESAPAAPEPVAEQIPVPAGYKEEVERVLNKSFSIEIDPHRDAPLVTVTIIVPEKYSTLSPSQKEMNPRDLRVKVITTAGGISELKEYLDLVYKSFTPEIQAMIVADRATV